MKRMANSWVLAVAMAVALAGMIAPRAAAQNDGTIRGQILDVTAKPWAEMPITAVSDQGAKLDTKTDKDGYYSFHNLRAGVYTVSVILPPPNKSYDSPCRVTGGNETHVDVNFKDVLTKQGAVAQEQVKKQEEQKTKFEGMKAHFAQGNTILEQERLAKAELTKAPADQRDAAKQKLNGLADQAVQEFKQAQQSAPEKDPNLHLIWAKLGDAYDTAARNDEAAEAYQQAITAKPDVPGYYNNLGNVLARAGKIDDAKAAYTKSAELDPPNAAGAWRNFGISLYNANRLGDAVEPLQKSVDLDPKSAQTWYLLGASLIYKMTTKKVGDKEEVVLAPGTVEAYQKALELDPNGPWGAQAKEGLEQLKALGAGIDTKVNVKKKKP